jgi:hypothetical protein
LRYDDFARQLSEVRDGWRSGTLSGAAASAEVDRLRELLAQVDAHRSRLAAYQVDAFAEWLTPASRERWAGARGVLDRALDLSVPPEQAIAAARNAIEQIDRIASTAPYADEEDALLQLTEPLEALIEELEEP